MRRQLTLWLGLATSVLFLYLSLRHVQFDEIRHSLSRVDIWLILLATAIFTLSFYLRAFRWRYILRPIKDIGLMLSFSLMSIGFMANNVLPARLGEVVRAYYLAKRTGIRKSLSLATIVVERLSDFAALLLSALLVTVFFSLPAAAERVGLFSGLLFVLCVVLLIAVHYRRHMVLGLFDRAFSILPLARRQLMMERVTAFVDGLLIIRTVRGILWIFAQSLVVWALWGVALHYTLLAFHIQAPLAARLLLLAVVNLGSLIPSSPGYVGPHQYLCLICLAVFGVDKSLAFSFSIVLHALWYVPSTGIGFFFLGREHLSISQIRAVEDQVVSTDFPMESDMTDQLEAASPARGDDGHESE